MFILNNLQILCASVSFVFSTKIQIILDSSSSEPGLVYTSPTRPVGVSAFRKGPAVVTQNNLNKTISLASLDFF